MRSKDRSKEFGEVFTPTWQVNQMLDKLPQEEIIDPTKTVVDITGCGNGNFLIEVLHRRLNAGVKHIDAIRTIYGVDIMEDNIQECKQRLAMGSKSKKVWEILDNNIICADALDPLHKGWSKVGYMWEEDYRKNSQKFLEDE